MVTLTELTPGIIGKITKPIVDNADIVGLAAGVLPTYAALKANYGGSLPAAFFDHYGPNLINMNFNEAMKRLELLFSDPAALDVYFPTSKSLKIGVGAAVAGYILKQLKQDSLGKPAMEFGTSMAISTIINTFASGLSRASPGTITKGEPYSDRLKNTPSDGSISPIVRGCY